MNRRDALRTLAAGASAGALAGGMAIMATPSAASASTALQDLIEAHRKADTAWCEAIDDEALEAVERAARLALLSYRPATMQEISDRLAYLYSFKGAWNACLPEEWELDAFHSSMMQGGA